jgi:hypothetical protein
MPTGIPTQSPASSDLNNEINVQYFHHKKTFHNQPPTLTQRSSPDLSEETHMSRIAQDLFELLRLAHGGAGALTQHLLREIAMNIIAPGVADARASC